MGMVRDEKKLSRVRDGMRREQIRALVSHVPENVTYLSGAWCGLGMSYVVLPLDGDPVLILPVNEWLPETWVSDVRRYPSETNQHFCNALDVAAETINEVLLDRGISSGTIGLEQTWGLFFATTMQYQFHIINANSLARKLAAYSIKDSSSLMVTARSVKTLDEVKALKKASRVAEVGLETFHRNLRSDLSEMEVSTKIENEIITQGVLKYGAKRVLARAFVVSGPMTAEGYKDTIGNTRRKLRLHDLVMLELIVAVDGYSSDTTRTFVVGKPTKKQRALFDAVYESQSTAISAIRPGVRAAEIAAISNDVIRQHGFDRYLAHRLGHGLGVSPHEVIPALHVESKDLMQPGMVHSVEPGIYGTKIGGVRIEDIVLDTESGAEYISEYLRVPD